MFIRIFNTVLFYTFIEANCINNIIGAENKMKVTILARGAHSSLL